MTEQRQLPTEIPAETLELNQDHWRKEIHARVAGYRSRRGRGVEGAFSMRFPFPPMEEAEPPVVASAPHQSAMIEAAPVERPSPAATLLVAEAQAEPSPILAGLTQSAPEEAEETGPDTFDVLPPTVTVTTPGAEAAPRASAGRSTTSLRTQSRRKVIAFPRQASEPAETSHRLADPVLPEQPRILDVPEELEAYPATPLLDGLQFAPSAGHATTTPSDHIELPFKAGSIPQRLYSGVVDCAIAVVAAAVFGAVVYKMLPRLVLTKPLLLAAAAVPVVLWGIYQYVFVVYGGATAGMRMARLRLRTFQGKMPGRRQRRRRVVGLYFSAASLMMGLLWVLVDVDSLCWHDRTSRTYLTHRD